MARALALFVALVAAGMACRPATADRSRGPANVIDSAVPRERELAEFRRGLARTEHLEGGEPTREALVRGFALALENRDTAALRRMVLSAPEFAWLYYPTTPQALPPYELSPELLWFTLSRRSEHDVALALDELGGRPFGYWRHTCAGTPRVEGENRLWGFCAIERRLPGGQPATERLFGLIIERDGQFKFVSYANRLS